MIPRSNACAWVALAAALAVVPACSSNDSARPGGDGGADAETDGPAPSSEADATGCWQNGDIACNPGDHGYSCVGENPASGGLTCTLYAAGQGGEVDYCCGFDPGNGEGGVPAAPGCTPTGELPCPGVAYPYACAAGKNPSTNHALACEAVGSYDSTEVYCCIPWSPTATCVPQDPTASNCPGANPFPFRCATGGTPGDTPSTSNSELMCDAGTLEASGQYTDFCCNYE
jgi:hypothetical protein